LMPYVAQVATGMRAELNVFGNDYPTTDGTGVRDYIHVMDLAEGHAAALGFLAAHTGWHAINLGTGQGYSVLEVVRAFEQASGHTVPYRIQPRRPGDVATCFADPAKARQHLGWAATRTLADMCASAWKYQLEAGQHACAHSCGRDCGGQSLSRLMGLLGCISDNDAITGGLSRVDIRNPSMRPLFLAGFFLLAFAAIQRRH